MSGEGDSGELEMCKDVRFERAVHVLAEKLGIRQRAGLGGTGSEDRQPETRGMQAWQTKPDPMDEIQLCAQGLCLKEMMGKTVSEGALWHRQTRHCVPIVFSDDLRAKTSANIVAARERLNSG